MPTNIYNIPTDLWNSLTTAEKAAFNYKFAGGIQIKDILYHPTMDTDITKTELPTTANTLTATDLKNIKTYFEELVVQNPIPGIVTGIVGSEINSSVSITKKFVDTLWNDLIKQTVHTLKNHTQFNI